LCRNVFRNHGLAKDIQELQRDIVAIQNELKTFQNPASLKSWLKGYKIPKNLTTMILMICFLAA